MACVNNLHQIGLGFAVYVQDNNDRLPVCAGYLPSQMPRLPSIAATLFPGQKTNQLFACPSDRTIFPMEQISYEWNFWLNGAPFLQPQSANLNPDEASVIVNTLFGKRDDTPVVGDANPFHGAHGQLIGKNALYFDGRAEKVRSQ